MQHQVSFKLCKTNRLVLLVAVEDLVQVGRDALRRRPEGAPPAAAPAAEAAAPARHTVDPKAEPESGEEVVTAAAAAVVSRRGRRGADGVRPVAPIVVG